MSAAASIAWNGIVVEVLNRENYLDWSALVENYLKGNDLWYNIIKDKDKQQQQQQKQNTRKENENDAEWENKNRRALHAIQLSCGKALGQIRKFKTAKEAWNHLKTSFSEDVKAHHVLGQTRLLDPSTRPLQNFMKKGFWEEAKLNINVTPRDIFYTSREDGRTALHMAVAGGHVELVKQLAETGKQRLLRMQDKKGYTALALAAKVTDIKEMAEWMVKYGGEELLTIAAKAEEDDHEGVDEIPVLLASAKGHREMTRYLFNHTPWSLLRKNGWQNCVVLLSRCIYNEIFDVAVEILQDPLAREMPLGHPNKNLRPIYALAHMPDAFPSAGTNLHWLKRFIYHKILSLEDINNGRIQIIIHETHETERPRIMTHTLPALGGLLRRFQQFVQTSILLKFSVFQKIYEEKMNHHLVLEILNCLCRRISEMSDVNLSEMSAHDAMLQAAKNGITEFIRSMASENAELWLAMDESNRGIFAHAILNRQEEVFQLIHDIENKEILTSSEDTLGNDLLHIAAELGPPRSLDRISNAALQMQRELQWFQEVKSVMPRWCDGAKDANGKTASELFTNDHKELLKSAQEWAKETGKSFTLVGTLIITIMFAAAFTVPGGTDDKKGTPIFLGKDIFNFFIVSVAVSLVTSSSSVLMFIGILTSRYAEDDFLTNLPLKLLFGLVTLFFSVAFMMSAFCAALALLLEGYYRIIIAAMWLALLPILVSVPFLLRLTLEIFHSTVRFDKIAAKKKIKESWIQD